MDVEARKFCGLLMFNKPFVSSKGPGSFDSSSNYNNNNNNNNNTNLSSSIIQSNYNINSSANPTTNNNRSNDYISLDNSNYNNIIKNNNNNSDDDKSSKDQDEKRPPRPPNAFILYRRARQPAILAAKRHLTNAEISRYISDLWKNESNETKLEWERYADQKKLEHMQAYPNYVYKPNKKGKNEKRKQQRKQSALSSVVTSTITHPSINNNNNIEVGPIRNRKLTRGQNRFNIINNNNNNNNNNNINNINSESRLLEMPFHHPSYQQPQQSIDYNNIYNANINTVNNLHQIITSNLYHHAQQQQQQQQLHHPSQYLYNNDIIGDDLASTQITPAQPTTPTPIATHTTQQLDQLQSTLWRIIPSQNHEDNHNSSNNNNNNISNNHNNNHNLALSTDLSTFQDQQPINSNNNNNSEESSLSASTTCSSSLFNDEAAAIDTSLIFFNLNPNPNSSDNNHNNTGDLIYHSNNLPEFRDNFVDLFTSFDSFDNYSCSSSVNH